ncbi:hypothetical protein SAMN02927924_00004 [Sphingobium faniae]|nr:hypothetical protein SAMN02927924_00004 [Sphingobium faniae]
MKISRRTLIKNAPLIAAPVVIGTGLLNGSATLSGSQPLVIFERGSGISSRFAGAFPATLQRFEIHDSGALQYQDIADVMADTSRPLVGLTGSATFLLFERLAAEHGRKFIITGSHLPCCEGGNVHTTRVGLTSSTTGELSDHKTWVEALAKSYLAMSLSDKSAARVGHSEPKANLTGTLTQPAQSWLLG